MTSIEQLRILATILNIFHITLVSFILFGWIFPGIRKTHLAIVALTGISWMIFSSVNVYGDCIITEWHWQILSKLGKTDLPETYSQYLFERITGVLVMKDTALTITRMVWLFIFILSLALVTRPLPRESRN